MFQRNIKALKNDSLSNTSTVTLLLYLPQRRNEKMEILMQFFQKHNLHMKRLQNKKDSKPYIFNKANFIVQSCNVVSEIEFEHISQFLFSNVSNVIVVALFYQKKMWSCSRLTIRNEFSPLLPPFAKSVSFLLKRFNFFRKDLQKFCL